MFESAGVSAEGHISHLDAPQKVMQQTSPQKSILTVILGIDGLHIVDLMSEQQSYNPQYPLSNIMEPLLRRAI
jgi:hypothetical protein